MRYAQAACTRGRNGNERMWERAYGCPRRADLRSQNTEDIYSEQHRRLQGPPWFLKWLGHMCQVLPAERKGSFLVVRAGCLDHGYKWHRTTLVTANIDVRNRGSFGQNTQKTSIPWQTESSRALPDSSNSWLIGSRFCQRTQRGHSLRYAQAARTSGRNGDEGLWVAHIRMFATGQKTLKTSIRWQTETFRGLPDSSNSSPISARFCQRTQRGHSLRYAQAACARGRNGDAGLWGAHIRMFATG